MPKEKRNEEATPDTARAGWQKVSGSGEILKWGVGEEIEGAFVGIRSGSLGRLLDMRDDSGEVFTYGCPTVLNNLMKETPRGTKVLIVCTGKKPSRSGNDMFLFDVYERQS